jgi:hypothetical protein
MTRSTATNKRRTSSAGIMKLASIPDGVNKVLYRKLKGHTAPQKTPCGPEAVESLDDLKEYQAKKTMAIR